ncbi:hypothetical protein BJ508DRAFT_419999 [Ascobolus immersus RN42]|uniref:Uncharacterized protein n=1 Tax=Ascobolus immersus RN42 TaxID=1160509 RepID=A0A3N4H913_ASCIM|nr:hypothetical protein BJ508DRAFT_419999 [Ascobolus immersus RN42]
MFGGRTRELLVQEGWQTPSCFGAGVMAEIETVSSLNGAGKEGFEGVLLCSFGPALAAVAYALLSIIGSCFCGGNWL